MAGPGRPRKPKFLIADLIDKPFYTVHELAGVSNYSPEGIRALINRGVIDTKQFAGEGSKINITRQSLINFLAISTS